MFQRAHLAIVGLAVLCVSGGVHSKSGVNPSLASNAAQTHTSASRASVQMGKLPLRFEVNAGQWDPRVRFIAHDHGATLFITDDGMTIGLRDVKMPLRKPGQSREDERKARETALAESKSATITMKLVGARPSALVGEKELVTRSNFFIGNDPTKWRTNVPSFAEVRAKDWRPGVDVVWHGGPSGLEYDLDVSAAIDASRVALEVEGASAITVSNDGTLVLTTRAGTLRQKPPRVVQAGRELPTRYRLDGARRVAFDIDGYHRGRPVLIDPALAYSTYLGGSSDESYLYPGSIAVDGSGCAYVIGSTVSTDFPTAGAMQSSIAGGNDAVVTKLNAAGDAILYSTYLGGSVSDYGMAIAVDGSGNAYAAGYTASTDFPTANAFQSSNGGGADAFVTKLNAAGDTILYSTYLGGSATDYATAIAVDGGGCAYITGWIDSTNFPTVNAFQSSSGGGEDAVVTKLSATGSSLAYSTYLGGNNLDVGYGIAVDGSGYAYVTGTTASTNFPTTAGAAQTTYKTGGLAFVTKVSTTGSALVYSTYLPGAEYGTGDVAVDGSGHAWVTGTASGYNLPLVNPIQNYNAGEYDVFVTEMSATGDAFVFSTFLGGYNSDDGYSIAVDGAGNAYVSGLAGSPNFPLANALQSSLNGPGDAFVTEISSGGGLIYSTFLGGNGAEYAYGIAADISGNVYVMGYTSSTDFPTVNPYQSSNAGGYDLFVSKITGGPVALGLSPSSATVAPKGSKTFTAYGGTGSGYTYSLSTNASSGTINSSTGAYTAGSTPNVTDVIEVTDSANSTAIANVTVGAGVSISPSNPTPAPKGTIDFGASGGSGTGFAWSLTTNASGGSINPSTGVYVAGATGSVMDVVHVADSLGNAASVNVNVGAGVSITPASPSLPPNGTVSFGASGGSGTGFTWAITTNASGATINTSTGAYTAGSAGNSLDTVTATDSLGNTASVVVNVGAGVTVSPPAPSTTPKGSVSFGASGGSGTGYTWSLLIDNSGATINAATGAYTAGAVGSVTDTVKVVDSLGNIGSATVTVGAGVSVAPASPTAPPKGAIGFTASGGSGTGYGWSLSTNASGGSINASTGAYVAGTTASVSDVVSVTDSLGNTSTTTVSVGPGITISPTLPSTPPNGAIAFTAVGGSGTSFTWSIAANNSGATINASTGAYVAGSKANVADTVTVVDSLGNAASVNVSVGGGLAINPAAPSTPPKGPIAFAVVGGSGKGFIWSLTANKSGGTIDASSGAYTAGTTPNVTDVVEVTDSLNNTSSVDVTVTAGVSITPTTATLASGASATFNAAGGSGKGYLWSISTNNSGGNITGAGVYTAGTTGGVTDTVQLVDSLGNLATATVTITKPGSSGGCGCTAAGRSPSSGAASGLLGLLAALLVGRRRKTLAIGRQRTRRRTT